jgi:NAD(P)-dependent dehydrogenase (short-subunit alcohol dehydrogenase family)
MPETTSDIRFDGRAVIVTGAGAGLGRAYAQAFAARGAQLVVNNRRSRDGASDAAGELATSIRAAGGQAVAESSDVTAPGAADAIVAQALTTYGRLDVLVHNAGLIESCPVSELTEADLRRLYEVNTLSAFRLARAVLPVMRQQRYGRIVFATSTAGLYGNAGLAAYGMAKAALLGLMHALADEEADHGILVNTVCPTAVTRMTETFVTDARLRAALSSEQVTPAVLYLSSDHCTWRGRVLMAGGGFFRSAHVLQSDGVDLRAPDGATPEQVAAAAERIAAPTGLHGYADAGAHFAALLGAVAQGADSASR